MKSTHITLASISLLLITVASCGGGVGEEVVFTNPYTFQTYNSDGNNPAAPVEEEYGAALIIVDDGAAGGDVVVTTPEERIDIENEDGSLDLTGTEWVLTSYIPAGRDKQLAQARTSGQRYTLNFIQNNVAVPDDLEVAPGVEANVDFELDHDSVGGFALCNRYAGNYFYTHPVLSIDTVRITDNICSYASAESYTPTLIDSLRMKLISRLDRT